MSQPEVQAGGASTAAAYLNLIQHQVREAERELKSGEHLRVVVCTPEGRVEALQFEGVDPNLLIVHGVRLGRRITLIAAIESAQVSIERVSLPPEEKPRYLGFRIPD